MKMFGKYDLDNIEINDKSLATVINLEYNGPIPHTFGRHANKQLAKMKVNIVERLVNKLMRGGTGEKTSGKVIRTHGNLQGKKLRLLKVVENAFDIIHKKTKENPVQVLVRAIENAAPREDVTRVSYGGISYQLAVDLSATRRLDMALRNITLSAIMKSFSKKTTLAEALADEIIYSSKGDSQNGYAIRKRDEIERIAKSAR